MAIDVNKPLELADGTPVTFKRFDGDGDITVVVPGKAGVRSFNPISGESWAGTLPPLRNVAPPVQEILPTLPDLSVLSLPDDDAKRGEYPMADGLLDYFPNALAEVSKVSKIGNDQHNPGQPMHWARDKSTDHANKIMRHLVDRGRYDGRGVRHTARLAWRALAMLQTEIEQEEGFAQSRRSTGQAPVQADA